MRKTSSLIFIALLLFFSFSSFAQTTLTYTYDALGRVTFVNDNVNGNRDFDYDKAGNRVLVSTGTASDATAEPSLLPAPQNPQYSLTASCVWRATWSPVSGAARYLVRDTTGGSQYVTTAYADISCPVGNSAGNKPQNVQACDLFGVCGTKANF